jgi:hypothetical protein
MIEITKETPKIIRKQECAKRIKDIIEKIGPFNVNKSQLAREYFLDWKLVEREFYRVLKGFPRENITNVKLMGDQILKKGVKYCEIVLADPSKSTKEKMLAIKTATDVLERYGPFFESLGDKLKADTTININVEETNLLAKLQLKMNEIKQKESKSIPCDNIIRNN